MQSLQRGVKCAAVLTFAAFTMSVSACSDIAGPSPEQIDPANAPRLAVSPQLPGLVAAYGFDEASGSTVDDGSGNNNTGTLGTGVTRTTAGKFGGALTFNRGYVSIPDAASLDLTTGLTLEAWVYPTATPTTWATVVLKEQPGDYVYTLYNSGPSNPSGEINVGTATSGERIALGPSPTPLNTWTHLTSTYDGSAVRLYVNGALVGIKAATGPVTASAGVLRIGGNTVWGEYFTGRIDEVRIYNRALSIGEIQTDMAKPVNGTAAADATAPTVSITSPTAASPYATTATTISLGGTASDNVGVTQVAWANDRGGAGTASGTASWTASGVALQQGTNNITVSARDAANNVATKMLTVTVSTASTAAAALSITTQPSASAASGTVFAQQPVVQLRDASNATVAQSGIIVTAAIASGTGTLGGTKTATTNASGVATFTNLSITGSGAYTLGFSAPGLTGATSSTITVAAPATTVSTGEPAFNAATNSMVYQDNMDSYTDVVSMGAVSPSTPRIVPRPSPVTTSQPVRTDDMQLITSGRSGKAIRMVYNGTVQNGPTFLTMNMPVTPDLATHYFQYYARVTPSSPFTNHLAHKWFLAYHRKNAAGRAEWDTHDHLPCTVDNRLTYWHFYDNGVETTCQGQQPIGPDFNNDIADGQWHRFTYEYRPNTSVGSRDGFARMWIDGVKMMDVSQATVGVIPPGGEKAWCAQDDVDNIAVNDGIFNQFWGSVQTSYTSPVWTLDIDDFSWWIKP